MKRQSPFISIIVTCYNYERYVAAAIESALGQTYREREVVVVNDGSTDDSLRVIRGFRDLIRVVDQPNQGLTEAYNAGFRASGGDIIVFLDADDLLAPDALALVVASWSPTCVKVQYDLKIIDGEGTDLGRRFCRFPAGYDADRVREEFRRTGTYRWPVTVGNAYARAFVETLFPMTQHGPDGLLNTLAPLYGDIHTIPEVLGSYRLHRGNSWSSGGSDERRLPERIRHRRREIGVLHEHAGRLGVTLPRGNLLDHELPFLNYRLMAWRLGLSYEDKANDSPARLLGRSLGVIRSSGYPVSVALAHSLWFSALFAAPRPLARALFQARFQRAQWRQEARRKAAAFFSLWRGGVRGPAERA